jgi:acetyl-CoA carboxylase beta subunit
MKIPTILNLNDLFSKETDCISFLMQKEIFYNSRNCPECGFNMKLQLKNKIFQSSKKTCRKACFIN